MRRFLLSVALTTLLLLGGWTPAVSQTAAQSPQRVDALDLQMLRDLAGRSESLPASRDVSFLGPGGRPRAGVRCGTRRVDEEESSIGAGVMERWRTRVGDGHRDGQLLVPVVFHVVTTRLGRFDVPRRQIVEQIEVLNEAFRERGFAFELLAVKRHVDSRFAKRCGSRKHEQRFKRRHAVDPARALNVYTCRPTGGVLGWSWFPSDWREESPMHGVVVRYSTLPGGSSAPYDEGDTVVHEVGHWAGLYHTFQGGCRGRGDRVDDTPAQASPTYGCPARRDSCPARPGDDPVENFMDYSDDVCMSSFTPDQQQRMLDQVWAFRPALARAAADDS